jgi:tetratricopeptide (TPR) repeat protein
MPGMRSENGIRLNMIPIFFKINNIERAEEFISKIDFLLFRKTILKAYYYMLFGYLLYKKGKYEEAQLKLDAAIQYPESAEWADPKLFQCAIFLKTQPEKGKIMFKELPIEPETYVEPFDDLYIELSKELK